MRIMGSILRNNRRMFWEILNRIIGRKKNNWDRPKGRSRMDVGKWRGVAVFVGTEQYRRH